jgi:hypothetical protein
MRRWQQYGLINKCTYGTKQAESGTGKRERMSIETADMEKIEHDRLEQTYGGSQPKIGRWV